MPNRAIRKFMALDLEEKILNGASLGAFICVFFPWVGGEWLGGKMITHSGLGFFTSFIGLAVLIIHLYVILITLIPLTGRSAIVKRENRDLVRLLATLLASILTIAIWSVLTKFTVEFLRLQIYFGLYGTMAGSFIALLYSFLLHQESRRSVVKDLFHQKDNSYRSPEPPPSPEPEEHKLRAE